MFSRNITRNIKSINRQFNKSLGRTIKMMSSVAIDVNQSNKSNDLIEPEYKRFTEYITDLPIVERQFHPLTVSRYSPKVNDFIKCNNCIFITDSNQLVYVSDAILFNYNLDIFNVDRLLSLIRFNMIQVDDIITIQIDNWIITKNNKTKTYTVKYSHEQNLYNELVKTDYDKLIVASNLLLLMNSSYINPSAKIKLEKWINENKRMIQMQRNLNTYCKASQSNFFTNEELKDVNFVIDINKLLTNEELEELVIMFSNSKNVLHDIKEAENPNKNVFKYPAHSRMVGYSQIYTTIDNTRIDLYNFYKYNGKKNFTILVNNIEEIKSKRHICKDIKPEELLVLLYTNAKSICDESKNRFITTQYAKSLLENRTYIGFVNGKNINMSFKNYPLIDFSYYDSSNNEKGLFNKIIYNYYYEQSIQF